MDIFAEAETLKIKFIMKQFLRKKILATKKLQFFSQSNFSSSLFVMLRRNLRRFCYFFINTIFQTQTAMKILPQISRLDHTLDLPLLTRFVHNRHQNRHIALYNHRTRDGWLRSANATSALCRLPKFLYC